MLGKYSRTHSGMTRVVWYFGPSPKKRRRVTRKATGKRAMIEVSPAFDRRAPMS